MRCGHAPLCVVGLPAFPLSPVIANFCQITPSLTVSCGSLLLPNSVLLATSPLSLGPRPLFHFPSSHHVSFLNSLCLYACWVQPATSSES